MLDCIFLEEDAQSLKEDPETQLHCILLKYKLASDLAKAFQVPFQQLITYAPSHIHGKMAYMLVLNANTLNVIEELLGLAFFLKKVLPRAWFYLI